MWLAYESGAKYDNHCLAGNVFAKVADVVGAKGSASCDALPERCEDAAPKQARRQLAGQVQKSGQNEPARAQLGEIPVALPQIVQGGIDRSTATPEDQCQNGQFRKGNRDAAE